MPHEVTLIATIAAAFGLAMVLGLIAVRLRLPALLGYLIAGVVIGPSTPGFVADVSLAQQLAEIGTPPAITALLERFEKRNQNHTTDQEEKAEVQELLVQAGEKVVVEGLQKVREGATVSPKPVPAEPTGKGAAEPATEAK